LQYDLPRLLFRLISGYYLDLEQLDESAEKKKFRREQINSSEKLKLPEKELNKSLIIIHNNIHHTL